MAAETGLGLAGERCDDDTNFSVLTVPELKSFLKKKGITANHNKAYLVQLAEKAVKCGINNEKQSDELDRELVQQRKAKLVVENGLITMPDPGKLPVDLWENDLLNAPALSEEQAESFVMKCAEKHGVHGTKSIKEGRSLLESGHVEHVQLHSVSPNISYCFIRAKVTPRMKQTQDQYSVWIMLQKTTGSIVSSLCGCMAGLRGSCKHVVALIHHIVKMQKEPDTKACTARPQAWHKPSKRRQKLHKPVLLDKVKVRKVEGTFGAHKTSESIVEPPSRSQFDPRAPEHRRRKTLKDFDLNKLSQITNGNCGVLLYSATPKPQSSNVFATEQNENCLDIPVQKEVTVRTTEEVPMVFDVRDIVLKTACDDKLEDLFIANLKTSQKALQAFEVQTRDQALCKQWRNGRVGRLTASNMYSVMKKVDDAGEISGKTNSVVATILGYYDEVHTPAVEWGKAMEASAIELYIETLRPMHSNIKSVSCGMFISDSYPFVGGSPDAIVQCDCHGKGVVEVKNPYSARSESIDEYAQRKDSCLFVEDGKVKLKRNHAFYCQVQTQMFVSDTQYADFVVCTKHKAKGLHVERIVFDNVYVQSVLRKAEVFYRNVIIPEICSPSLLIKYVELHVRKMILSVVNKAADISETNKGLQASEYQ